MNPIASNIIDFVLILSKRDGNHNIDRTMHRASHRQLWCWWLEAQTYENTATTEHERKLAMAMSAKLGREAVRRCGPESMDNPNGFVDDEEPETRTGVDELPLEVGRTLD